MTYQIVMAYDSNTLAEAVNTAISKGWKPQGGVAAVIDTDFSTSFYQAMIKEDK